MTMQAVLVGSDGIVLVSDTRVTNSPRDANMARLSGDGPKIFSSGKLVIACAQETRWATAVAKELVEKLPREVTADEIVNVVEKHFDRVREPKRRVQCFILCSWRTAFRMEVAEDDRIVCERIKENALAGDTSNPAVFWKERYFQRHQPVNKLIRMAAMLVISAHHLNTAMIDGLQVVVYDKSGIHFLPEETILQLEKNLRVLTISCRDN